MQMDLMPREERGYEGVVDLPELLARVEHDVELLREVLAIFTSEFPMLRLELQDALERDDLRGVQETAHTLKGMLLSLSFGGASHCAMRIERMAALGTREGMPQELVLLERSAEAARERLAGACGGEVR